MAYAPKKPSEVPCPICGTFSLNYLADGNYESSAHLGGCGNLIHDSNYDTQVVAPAVLETDLSSGPTPGLDVTYTTAKKFRSGVTSNATPVTTAFLQIPENSMVGVCADVRAVSGANRKRFKIEGTFIRGAGNASIVGTNIINSWGSPSWAATLVATGQGVAVQITGAAGTTITWAGKISYEAAVL